MKIEQLTPEQEALIPVYREKWLKIATSTEPLDYRKARKALKATYKIIGRKEPTIIFVKSPASIWKYIVKHSMPLLEYKEIVRQLNVEMTSIPLIKIAGKIEFKKLSSLLYWRLEYGIVAEQIIDMFDE